MVRDNLIDPKWSDHELARTHPLLERIESNDVKNYVFKAVLHVSLYEPGHKLQYKLQDNNMTMTPLSLMGHYR